MGLLGHGDPTFIVKIEQSCPCAQVLPGLGPKSKMQFLWGPKSNQIWVSGWGSHICGDESAESGLKSPR